MEKIILAKNKGFALIFMRDEGHGGMLERQFVVGFLADADRNKSIGQNTSDCWTQSIYYGTDLHSALIDLQGRA